MCLYTRALLEFIDFYGQLLQFQGFKTSSKSHQQMKKLVSRAVKVVKQRTTKTEDTTKNKERRKNIFFSGSGPPKNLKFFQLSCSSFLLGAQRLRRILIFSISLPDFTLGKNVFLSHQRPIVVFMGFSWLFPALFLALSRLSSRPRAASARK